MSLGNTQLLVSLGCSFAVHTLLSMAVFTHLGPCGCHIVACIFILRHILPIPLLLPENTLLSGESYIIAHQPQSLEMF